MKKTREFIYLILKKYYLDKAYLNIELSKYSTINNANLVKRIVYGVVESDLYLDYILKSYKFYPENEKINILGKMALYEYKYIENSKKEIITNEIVDVAKIHVSYAAKYLNMFLNALYNEDLNITPTYANSAKNLSIKYSINQWIVKKLMQQYPENFELIINDSYKQKDFFVTKLYENDNLDHEKFEKLEGSCYKYLGENILLEPDYLNKKLIIQDYGSNVIVNALTYKKTDSVIEFCSAPGGKTLGVAVQVKNVLALELHSHRVNLVVKKLKEYEICNVQIEQTDSTDIEQIIEVTKNKKFDVVLIDAPCSGWGVIKNKPEIRYSNIESMNNVVNTQHQMLQNATILTEKYSIILYSTCTLNKEENEQQIKRFLKENSDFILIYERTILPYEYNSGGFYYAILEKNEK